MKEPKQNLNRLILVGNGFDLMNGLKSSYADFLKDYLYNCVNSFLDNHGYPDDGLIEITYEDSYFLTNQNFDKEDILEYLNDIVFDSNSLAKVSIIKSPFFERIYNNLNYGWVDVEREYYSLLIKYYEDNNKQEYESSMHIRNVRKLNSDLDLIRKLLKDYLKNEQEKYDVGIDEKSNSRPAFGKVYPKDFPQLNVDHKNDVNKVMFLNFNYTSPKFISDYSALKYNYEIINIHGTLNNDNMIFGYGDELDEHYNSIEKLGDDEWLKGFKSFGYLQNDNYDKLLGFIESGEYQIYVAGHSCGLSDKTLLNQIFEHKNCLNIKVFYHQFTEGDRKGEDTFNDTIYNISRIMDDKVKLRNIVSKKTHSRPIKDLDSLAPVKEIEISNVY